MSDCLHQARKVWALTPTPTTASWTDSSGSSCLALLTSGITRSRNSGEHFLGTGMILVLSGNQTSTEAGATQPVRIDRGSSTVCSCSLSCARYSWRSRTATEPSPTEAATASRNRGGRLPRRRHLACSSQTAAAAGAAEQRHDGLRRATRAGYGRVKTTPHRARPQGVRCTRVDAQRSRGASLSADLELSSQPEEITAFSVRADLAGTHELQLLQYAQRWPIPDPDRRP